MKNLFNEFNSVNNLDKNGQGTASDSIVIISNGKIDLMMHSLNHLFNIQSSPLNGIADVSQKVILISGIFHFPGSY